MPSAIEATGVGCQLLQRLWEARRQTDELFRILRADALYDRPIRERHRIVFYIGHLEAFDWNLLHERVLDVRAFHPELDHLFAFGIDPVDGGLPTDLPEDWPTIEQVRRYVEGVRARIDEGLAEVNLTDRVSRGESDCAPETLLNVAIEHRLMHAETLAYMFHQLPYDRKITPADYSAGADLPSVPLESRMIEIPGGRVTLGLSRGESKFGWDNEYESHVLDVPAFAIENHKVTNQRYLEFMEAGGYETPEFWSASDWQWRSSSGINCPVFWKRTGDGWSYRTMFRDIELPLEWPVYVSQAEASAYARWANKVLPSEAQWHRAVYGIGTGTSVGRQYPWGDADPDSQRGNFDFARWNPTPAGAYPDGVSAFGLHDTLGNGWEWTSSEFRPFTGFKEFSFYPGYSANFFDGKHFVIKGGSARTAASMLRRSFRNWFQPHYQYVYAGFRCVSN